MASDTRSPGTVVDDASAGSAAWSNPANAAASDDTYATASAAGTVLSRRLKATNFGFTIPDGATVDGIVVEAEVKRSGAASEVFAVRVVKGGTVGAQNRASDAPASIGTSDAYKTYGSSSQLWGETWTPADINSSDFGAAVQVTLDTLDDTTSTVSVDHIRVTVHYTEGAVSGHVRRTLLGVG